MSPGDRADRAWRQHANPPRPTKGSVRSGMPRMVAIANAYVDWSDMDKVVAIYRCCAVLNELDLGQTYTVDHVVPLQSSLVCGLHAHTNLRITPYGENRLKGNFLWPQMWSQDWSTMQMLLDRAD